MKLMGAFTPNFQKKYPKPSKESERDREKNRGYSLRGQLSPGVLHAGRFISNTTDPAHVVFFFFVVVVVVVIGVVCVPVGGSDNVVGVSRFPAPVSDSVPALDGHFHYFIEVNI